MERYQIVSFKQRPETRVQIEHLSNRAWPEFLRHANILHWESLYTTFSEYQLMFCESNGSVIGVAHTVPFIWNGTPEDLPPRLDDLMARAVDCHAQGASPNTLSAVAAIVSIDRQGQGLSSHLVEAMAKLAAAHGHGGLIAPVRPVWKSRYPLTPFHKYVEWKRADGAPYDPWLRVHWRLGARPLRIAEQVLSVIGCIAEWEAWTGMNFPETARYVVPGALEPVVMDCEHDEGLYVEPNLWMLHPVNRQSPGRPQ